MLLFKFKNIPKLLGIFIFLYFTQELFAQSTGARSASLGSISIGLNDAWSVSNNSSEIIFSKHSTVGANYENRFWMKELSERTLSFSGIKKNQAIGLAISQFGFTNYNKIISTLSYVRLLSKNFSMAINANYFQLHLGEIYGNRHTVLGGLSFTWKPNEEIQFGFVLNNATGNKLSAYNNERISPLVKFGIGYRFNKKVAGFIESEKSLYQKFILKSGLEYLPNDNLALRIGYRSDASFFCFGFGYNIKNIKIEIGCAYHMQLGYSPQVSFTYMFK